MIRLYDILAAVWQNHRTDKFISNGLIIGFITGLILVVGNRLFEIPWLSSSVNYFLAIDIAFQILLIIEILGLIFILPKSVADSMGKQFEILSIILLRSAFKEFGKFSHPVEWSNIVYEPLFHMLSDAFGALLIFLIIGVYYKKQLHTKITETKKEQEEFISFKKVLAIILLGFFVYLGAGDLIDFIQTGSYVDSFNAFYTALIFMDILILLFSLRYSSKYYNLFRYSSFAFATILIRVALTAPAYTNIFLGVTAGLFVLGLTITYNHFMKP
ncbi:MAG: hypothetical protein RIC06_24525 [Cyclobacteriaceae bacterium]